MAKTNKSILKRMYFTKQGKIIRLGAGINHFQAKKRRLAQLQKKQHREISETQKDAIKAYLYH
ncbi:MAG: 50S ribosomal protein L35 [Patescibacteria group bacterium]